MDKGVEFDPFKGAWLATSGFTPSWINRLHIEKGYSLPFVNFTIGFRLAASEKKSDDQVFFIAQHLQILLNHRV